MATNALPQAVQYRLVDYRKAVYEVIEEHGNLVRIRPQGEEDTWHAFWIQRTAIVPHVVKPLHKLYHGIDLPDYIVTWCMAHLVKITAIVPVDHEARFAYNLENANGQVFTPLMDGVRRGGAAGIAMYSTFNEDVPSVFNEDVYDAQLRWGCRKNADRNTTDNPREIFCNALAWELLRNGKQLG